MTSCPSAFAWRTDPKNPTFYFYLDSRIWAFGIQIVIVKKYQIKFLFRSQSERRSIVGILLLLLFVPFIAPKVGHYVHLVSQQSRQVFFHFKKSRGDLNSDCIRRLLRWPNKDDRKPPCKMTESAEDCKRYAEDCKQYIFFTLNLTE